jgi:hypothetical protein
MILPVNGSIETPQTFAESADPLQQKICEQSEGLMSAAICTQKLFCLRTEKRQAAARLHADQPEAVLQQALVLQDVMV